MGILCITLAAIIGGLLLICRALWLVSLKYQRELYRNDPSRYFEKDKIEETYPCTLLIDVIDEAGFNGVAYDFSTYKENGIIGLTQFDKQKVPSGKNSILLNQKVYLMKDGSYQWDFRSVI